MPFFTLNFNDGKGTQGEFKMSHLNAIISALVVFALGVFYQYGREIAHAWNDFRAVYQQEYEEQPESDAVTLTLADIAGIGTPKKKAASKPKSGPSSHEAVVKTYRFSRSSFPSSDQYAYVKRFHEVATGEMSKYGIPASIKLAQGLLESSAGTSFLATKTNNHFGIKCFSTSCAKGHCTNMYDDSHKDFFRNYSNAWESWRNHSKRITSGRYEHIGGKCGNDYKCWARELKAAGYATAPDYAEKLIDLILKLNLWAFDGGVRYTID